MLEWQQLLVDEPVEVAVEVEHLAGLVAWVENQNSAWWPCWVSAG